MARVVTIGAAQTGPIQRAQSREAVVGRMLALMERAKAKGAGLIVFPELALTTFFPRWYMTNQDEVDARLETAILSNEAPPSSARTGRPVEAAAAHDIGLTRRLDTGRRCSMPDDLVHDTGFRP